ncbi:DUF6745 domain-containing protein, partial [Pseudonocardia lacus]|uniref:DUF6745 domain-containing protein n=1 Tax=Pseudonocardia lacus TaxID=2835865 RepID=UPI0038B511A4
AVDPWAEAYLLARHRQAFAAAGLAVPERLAALDRAVRRAGWWWPLPDAVVLTERPTALRNDRLGRLHSSDGPAMVYADGVEVHAWHGVPVPADLVEGDGWAVPRILAEPDADLRRCAVERRGWERFVVEAGLPQVGAAEPDPGNPGRELRLYELPAGIHGAGARLLICENGSPDRDGTHRRFGLPVPADIPDPTSAAAWTYGVDREEYAGVQRRT